MLSMNMYTEYDASKLPSKIMKLTRGVHTELCDVAYAFWLAMNKVGDRSQKTC